MDSFKVRSTLTQKDWQALTVAAGARIASRKEQSSNLLVRAAPVLSWILLVAVIAFAMAAEPPLMTLSGVAITTAAFFGFMWLQYVLQRRGCTPGEDGAFLGSSEFEFDARGFITRRFNSESFNQWSLVKDITCTDEHVFLWIDVFSAYVVPARDLPPPMNAHEAARHIREFMAAAAKAPATESAVPATAELAPDASTPDLTAPAPELSAPTPMLSAAVPPAAPTRPSVAQELSALARLQTWGLVDSARLFGRDTTLILLGLFSLALWAGLERLNYEGEVELLLYTLPGNGILLLAVLFTGWLMSRISRPRIEMRQSLLLALGFLPLFIVVMWFADKLPKFGTILIIALMIGWAERYLSSGMRSLTGKRQSLAVSSVLVSTLLLVYLSAQIYFSPGIWYVPDADTEQAETMRRDNEQLVFEQSIRLTAAIDAMPSRVAGKANAFFVGFAGYGGQRVFAEEIKLASKRVGARYDVGERSLLLINDRRDNEKHPIATTASLRHALKEIGKRMNVDEDVLFLSLSSHGSEDATVSVVSELGYFRDLGAADLAAMLRESGIRWKVIVISACHAGSFIEALRDENTVVLTAAAAERASFGCSDENDLTYFGEAFYRDALPGAASLREAFEAARTALKGRELAEGRVPSDPQASYGALMEAKLGKIEDERAPRPE